MPKCMGNAGQYLDQIINANPHVMDEQYDAAFGSNCTYVLEEGLL